MSFEEDFKDAMSPWTDVFDDPPPPVPPPIDPRSPVRQLLDLYVLDMERLESNIEIIVNTVTDAVEAVEDATAAALGLAPWSPGQPTTPANNPNGGGANTHVSSPAIHFPSWDILDSTFPAEFQTPIRISLYDIVAVTTPAAPDPPATAPSWLDEYLTPIKSAISQLEHSAEIDAGVQERVSLIKQARALMPVIPQGSGAGMLQAIGNYETAINGHSVTGSGWMFQEPASSEYGLWFAGQMKSRYDGARAALAQQQGTQDAVGNAAACIAVANQEAAPSGINTYDGRVLSWGIGLAAPGYLQKVMYFIQEDPKVHKVFYCCGYLYDADIRTAGPGSLDVYHGKYQIVDLAENPPGVVYGDNWHHDTVAGQHKKGDFKGNGYLTLKAFTAQLELIYMLIQVARDPETRDGVFACNYNFISGAVTVNGSELLASEALYVFVAQVQHNWAIASEAPVRAGIATFDSAEKALQLPSEDGDKAIAKGVVRVLMRVLQEQRFQNAANCLRTGKYPDGLDSSKPLKRFRATTEYGLPRLLKKYWGPLLTGANTQDKSRVVVTDFLLPTLSPAADSYVWNEGLARYDFGPHQRMRMRFPHDDFLVFAVIDSRSVRVRNERTGEEWNEVDKH